MKNSEIFGLELSREAHIQGGKNQVLKIELDGGSRFLIDEQGDEIQSLHVFARLNAGERTRYFVIKAKAVPCLLEISDFNCIVPMMGEVILIVESCTPANIVRAISEYLR